MRSIWLTVFNTQVQQFADPTGTSHSAFSPCSSPTSSCPLLSSDCLITFMANNITTHLLTPPLSLLLCVTLLADHNHGWLSPTPTYQAECDWKKPQPYWCISPSDAREGLMPSQDHTIPSHSLTLWEDYFTSSSQTLNTTSSILTEANDFASRFIEKIKAIKRELPVLPTTRAQHLHINKQTMHVPT